MSEEELARLVLKWMAAEYTEEEDASVAAAIEEELPGFISTGINYVTQSTLPDVRSAIQKHRSALRVMVAGKEVEITYPHAGETKEKSTNK